MRVYLITGGRAKKQLDMCRSDIVNYNSMISSPELIDADEIIQAPRAKKIRGDET
jgi:hypothetical protein